MTLSYFTRTVSNYSRRLPEAACGKSQEAFDVNSITGFLPAQPLRRLPKEYDIWETALVEAQTVLSLGTDSSNVALAKRQDGLHWRGAIREWPVLSIDNLRDDVRRLQRAHYVLAFLVHWFVHSIPPTEPPSPVQVPRGLAMPLVAVSHLLRMAPVLTFADTVMWNAQPENPDHPVSVDNLRFEHLLSGTEDEYNFYLMSARAELQAVEALHVIKSYHDLPNTTDLASVTKIGRDLARVTAVIQDITATLESSRGMIDPHSFYFNVRPWWKGSDGDGPDSPGWIYEGVTGMDQKYLSGPSAGQSAAMHALDIFLDIDHKLAKRRSPAPSKENKKADLGFMERMRQYMLGQHREYLEYLASTPRPLREVVRQNPALREPYNTAVRTLKKFRDVHIRIACLYIVSMSKSQTQIPSQCPASAMLNKAMNEANENREPVRGTGGTALVPLLKAGRDATARTVLQ
ncbi:Indoleamine 2,3-dioxygenase [Neolentinus lepideus HHB14362 ss-1]|uniref:Indoleamine 2,3-dioxygenase n=1 Tax=Neolentinus lepideus HHB14362 ss-1 TaxID=1314782 RepID=A0A165TY05_9AGAM|nr:Indoleamine 2,3-dioxygenase [Neolentinus lepideus HHB14362 ss-1]